MSPTKYGNSKFYSSWIPSVISIITSVIPFVVVGLGLSINPWFIVAYSFTAIPIGAISVVMGLIGLKTKLYKLAIVSLTINLIVIIVMVTGQTILLVTQ